MSKSGSLKLKRLCTICSIGLAHRAKFPRLFALDFLRASVSPWLILFRKNFRIRTADVICIQRFHGYGLAFQ